MRKWPYKAGVSIGPRPYLTTTRRLPECFSHRDGGLAVGVAWWSIGMVLAAIYFVLIYRLFRGKVSLEDEGY